MPLSIEPAPEEINFHSLILKPKVVPRLRIINGIVPHGRVSCQLAPLRKAKKCKLAHHTCYGSVLCSITWRRCKHIASR